MVLDGHADILIRALAWSQDDQKVITGGDDGRLILWDAIGGTPIRSMDAGEEIWAVQPAQDGKHIAVGTRGSGTQVWRADTGKLVRTGFGPGTIYGTAWSPDNRFILIGHEAPTAVIWNWKERWGTTKGLSGHRESVRCVDWSRHGLLASGSEDGALRLWNPQHSKAKSTLHLRSGTVRSTKFSPSGKLIATGCQHGNVIITSTEDDSTKAILEAHRAAVVTVDWAKDSSRLLTASEDSEIILWDASTWTIIGRTHLQQPLTACASDSNLDRIAFSLPDGLVRIAPISVLMAQQDTPAFVTYRNAKIVLVGDSGVGKTGLGLALSGEGYRPTESTHGQHVWKMDVREVSTASTVEAREVFLWDLAGQPGYKIFHRQHLDDAAIGVVVFDARSDSNPFLGVPFWARALDEANNHLSTKFLVASRSDRNGPVCSTDTVQKIVTRYGFSRFFETSAKRGAGIDVLRKSLLATIPWEKLPVISSKKAFFELKKWIFAEKNGRRVFLTFSELHQAIDSKLASEADLRICIARLQSAGLLKHLEFGDLILLRPELIDAYGAWLARVARNEAEGLGFISKKAAIDLRIPPSELDVTMSRSDERLLLTAAVEDLIARGIALVQPTEKGELLVFPTELRSDLSEYPGSFTPTLIYRFRGPVKSIHATLAVALAHAPAFRMPQFYHNAAILKCESGHRCGFKVDYPDVLDDSLGEITAFFDASTPRTQKLLFLRYIHHQVTELAFEGSIDIERIYQCICGLTVPSAVVEWCTQNGMAEVACGNPKCKRSIPIDRLASLAAEPDAILEEQIARSIDEQDRQSRLTVMEERSRSRQFQVFVSYNSSDKKSVVALVNELRNQGVLPWVDFEQILPGDSILKALEEAVETIGTAIIVVGPSGTGPWQQEEYERYLSRAIASTKNADSPTVRLIPVLLPGTPAQPQIPPLLSGKKWVDFRNAAGLTDTTAMRELLRGILRESI